MRPILGCRAAAAALDCSRLRPLQGPLVVSGDEVVNVALVHPIGRTASVYSRGLIQSLPLCLSP